LSDIFGPKECKTTIFTGYLKPILTYNDKTWMLTARQTLKKRERSKIQVMDMNFFGKYGKTRRGRTRYEIFRQVRI
jgi:hypothetical protein